MNFWNLKRGVATIEGNKIDSRGIVRKKQSPTEATHAAIRMNSDTLNRTYGLLNRHNSALYKVASPPM